MNEERAVIQMLKAFPSTEEARIRSLFKKVHISPEYFHEYTEYYTLNNSSIAIPYRIGIDANILENKEISNAEKRLLSCYLTRHHDGFVRQRCLSLITTNNILNEYDLPYIFHLCGEYVIEIILDAFGAIKLSDPLLLQQFISKNQKQINLIEYRMISYWNEYYRRTRDEFNSNVVYKNWEDYPAFKLVELLIENGYSRRK